MAIPKDPVILLSYVNTQLRDYYPTLEELCKTLSIDITERNQTLERINYFYDTARNQLNNLLFLLASFFRNFNYLSKPPF